MINSYWEKYCFIIRSRFEAEVRLLYSFLYLLSQLIKINYLQQNSGENTIIVRAVDRFYRRMQSINKQITNLDLSVEASNIALYAATIRVKYYLEVLKKHFNGSFCFLLQSKYLIILKTFFLKLYFRMSY